MNYLTDADIRNMWDGDGLAYVRATQRLKEGCSLEYAVSWYEFILSLSSHVYSKQLAIEIKKKYPEWNITQQIAQEVLNTPLKA